MSNQSWVKLYRKITEWEWYSHPPTRDLFIHLLLTVNHKPTKYRGYDIPSGAAIYGRKEIAVLLGFSEQNIRTALVNLKSTNEITIKTTNKFSIIQIVRWDEYQSSTSNLTNNQPTTNQQLTTDKEYKNIINKKDNTYVLSKKNTNGCRIDYFFSNHPDGGIDSKNCPDELGNWAIEEFRWDIPKTMGVWGSFCDYWLSKTGAGATKRDWPATWRNWCRKAAEQDARSDYILTQQTKRSYQK
jgi:hypothetical protein